MAYSLIVLLEEQQFPGGKSHFWTKPYDIHWIHNAEFPMGP